MGLAGNGEVIMIMAVITLIIPLVGMGTNPLFPKSSSMFHWALHAHGC